MTEFRFYLTDDTFNKLATLKEQETDPEVKDMTFNEYARALLEMTIWTKYKNRKQTTAAELPF